LCFVIVVGNFSATVQAQPSSTGGKLLTNESIISLVKTGLSDTAIISLIQKSPTQFDLSPESLVRLKGAGVSNSVIEAMIGSQSLPANSEKASLIPTAYGFYVVDEGQLRELKPSPVITKIGLQPGGPRSRLAGSAMDGFAGEPPFSIASQAPIFIVYQQNVNPNDFHLANLVYVSTKQAGQFNYFGTNPMFFRNLYGVNESDIIRIDLWRPKAQIPLRIEPVEGKTGMFRLIPNSPLKPDKYTLYLKDAIHLDGTIFISETDRQSSAFYFKVE
jgi:hypothetical protein